MSGRRVVPLRSQSDSICLRCWVRLSRTPPIPRKQPFASSTRSLDRIHPRLSTRSIFRREYFSANGSLTATGASVSRSVLIPVHGGEEAVASTSASEALHPPPLPSETSSLSPEQRSPTLELLDRRKRRRRLPSNAEADPDRPLPLDASSRLSTISSSLPPRSLRRLFTTYLSLSKPRLSFLIVLTTASAYSLYPVPAVLLPSATVSPSLSALTLLFLTSGTALCCASANALNMLLEPEHDAKMSRTRNRPIVRGLIGKKGALVFAAVAGVLGTGGLWFGVNPTVAFLGLLNIVLYAGVYTPMKRVSPINTWIGALVGGIPPLMGWAAAAGQSATGSGDWQELLLGQENIGGWLLAGLLFAWQFPHFNALSWPIREEYKNAGYRMLVWTNSKMNGRVALRYSLLLVPLCFGLTYYGITDRGFLVTSSVVNAWVIREAWKFWRKEGHRGSARGLFWATVWHLPVVMVLAMAHKRGLWEGIWRRMMGEEEDDDEVWIYEDEDVDERPIARTLKPAGSPVTSSVF